MIKKYREELNNAYVDCFYEYTGIWDVPSRCGLKIIRTEKADIVIATELYLENPGTSVTEFCNRLATRILKEFHLDPSKFIFIVRTPENRSKLSFLNESFSWAKMQWNGSEFGPPQWEPLSKETVNAMLNTH